jgi:hypothetical protein
MTVGQSEVPTFTVLVFDCARVPLQVLNRAERQVKEIYRAVGVNTVWRAGTHKSVLEGPGTVTLILVIRPHPAPTRRRAPRVLGVATVGSTEHRAASVFYNHIESLARSQSADPAQILGHVIAHELGHLLLPSNAHSTRGIMGAELEVTSVHPSAGHLRFTAAEGELIRTRLSGVVAPGIAGHNAGLQAP